MPAMTSVPRRIPGLLALVAAFAIGWAIYHLLLTGSCSTPPSDGLPACPPDTWKYVVALIGGIFLEMGVLFAGGGWIGFYGIFLGIGFGGIAASRADGGEEWFLFFGLCFLVSPLLGPILLVGAGLEQARARRLVEHGAQAIGTVLSIQDTGVTLNNNPRVRLRFRIEPVDGATPPYEAAKVATVSRVDVPRPGDRLPVWFDPANPATWTFSSRATPLPPSGGSGR